MQKSAPAVLVFAIACAFSITVFAADPPPAVSPSSEDAPVTDAQTGRQIYDKVLANRFRATRQNAKLISGDRSGNAMESRMTVLWKTFRDDNDKAVEGVFSKTVDRKSVV